VAIQLRLRLIHPHSARFTVSNWKFTTEAGGIITHPATPEHAGDLINRLNSNGGCKIRQPRMKAFALTVARACYLAARMHMLKIVARRYAQKSN